MASTAGSTTSNSSSNSNSGGGGGDGATTNHRDPSGYLTNPSSPSTVVKVVGTARDDINGLLGIAVSYNVERERYLVFMPASQSTMALKVQNLQLASTMEKYRCQFQQLQNDPRVKEKVAHYIKMAEKYVRPFQLKQALGGAFVVLTLLVYLFGFTRTVMLLSLLMLLGIISGRDMLQRKSVKEVIQNFPNRANETLSKQLPFLKGKLTNKMALGIVLALIAFTFQSLFFPNGVSAVLPTNNWLSSGSSGSSSPNVSSGTTGSPYNNNNNNQPRLDRETMEKFYNLGFDDAKNDMDRGRSLQPELSKLEQEQQDAATSKKTIQSFDPVLDDRDGDRDDVGDDDELFLTRTPPPQQRSIMSKLANFSTLGSLFFVYRIIKEKGMEQSTGLFSLGQLAANLQHHTDIRQQGILLFSLYNLFRIFMG
eukprot:CAMPEP_0113442920 /NCGR_PEP_ID=MMETSP0014_2-20120614/1866_1 /TAXON_ID=2857 /ORGANISM="Nitzschia sp." /LENGTH=423 /DNA_ID=CAMNT_0000333849 /DNA_START=21 /DNA_END=1292 /DNA_ORIENTATION=- /assembly_acc=CAM_ASM_000159